MNWSIYEEARQIGLVRSEEKDREYGSFPEGMKRAAMIASGMLGKEITDTDMHKILVALKFSRDSFHPKYDNMLDSIVYMAELTRSHQDMYKSDTWVLYDLDGTLIDSTQEHVNAYAKAMDAFDIKVEDDYQFLVDNLHRGRWVVFNHYGIPEENWDKIRAEKYKLLEIKNMRPRDWLIKRLVDSPARTGIITSNSRAWVDRCAAEFDMPMWGVEYIACDAKKPSRKSGLEFLIKTNSRPQDIHYIGDTDVDEAYAKACGFNYHHYLKVYQQLTKEGVR